MDSIESTRFNSLPEDVLLNVISFLTLKERIAIQRVNKRFNLGVTLSIQKLQVISFLDNREPIKSNSVRVSNLRQVNSVLRKIIQVRGVSFKYVSAFFLRSEDVKETANLIANATSFEFSSDDTVVDKQFLSLLVKNLSHLEELTITDHRSSQNWFMPLNYILRKNQGIKVLRLGGNCIAFNHTVLPKLTELVLDVTQTWNRHNRDSLSSLLLKIQDGVEKIDVKVSNYYISLYPCMARISSFTTLKYLRMPVDPHALSFLVVENLEALDLRIYPFNYAVTFIQSTILSLLERNPQLRVLHLHSKELNDDFVNKLCKSCTNLRYLSLDTKSGHIKLTKNSLRCLTNLPYLEGLDLLTESFSDNDISGFVSCSNSLRSLKIGVVNTCVKRTMDAFMEKAKCNPSANYYLMITNAMMSDDEWLTELNNFFYFTRKTILFEPTTVQHAVPTFYSPYLPKNTDDNETEVEEDEITDEWWSVDAEAYFQKTCV